MNVPLYLCQACGTTVPIKWHNCAILKTQLCCQGGMAGGCSCVIILILQTDDGAAENVKWVYPAFYK